MSSPSAGALIGTVGMASEWVWSHVCLPITEDTSITAEVTATPAGRDADTGAPIADLAIVLSPGADAMARDAAWFDVLAWQGSDADSDGGFVLAGLSLAEDGTWRTDEPVPVGGAFKTVLRLHAGAAMQGVALHLPADPELGAAAVELPDGPRAFQREKSILQREARTDNVATERGAYLALLLVALLWMVTLSWGLRRLDPSVDDDGRWRDRPVFAGRGTRARSTPKAKLHPA